ncbi:MAG: sialate O-acetylesterase [Bacteroidota bacterium]|nr:sialate O-acetylesterase [Bacteroidota bacterium]
MKRLIFLFTCLFCLFVNMNAQLSLHNWFDHHMVVQRDKVVNIWGTATPGDTVEVHFNTQTRQATVNANGDWSVQLDPMSANGNGQTLKVTNGEEIVLLQDVLIGDVWVLTGQSNMEFDLKRIHHGDVEIASAHFPEIRLLTVPYKATPDPQKCFERLNEWDGWYGRYDVKGFWLKCNPETVPTFSGLGYIFGRRVHMASQVPIGLVDVSVGGTTVEAWTTREKLLTYPENRGLIELWDERIKDNPEKAQDRNNPGAPYNAMMHPLKGAVVTGIVFHQGFNNALGDSRPKLYTKNLQLMIEGWREFFGENDLPLGIVDLSAGGQSQTLDNYGLLSLDAGAYIREAQLQAYKDLENIGFVTSYDRQVNWYHPQRKIQLGERMARWALTEYYDFDFGWKPALPVSVEKQEGTFIIGFDREVRVVDGRPISGMSLAGKDRKFYPAKAEFLVSGKDDRNRDILDHTKVLISCDQVPRPEACRYAWARNPLGNLTNAPLQERVIAVPPFRTDDWDWPEAPFVEGNTDEWKAHRAKLQEMKKKYQ